MRNQLILAQICKGGILKMGYEHTNSRGQKYYLHQKGRLFYFSKDSSDGIDMPEGFIVVENERTGLPMLKKK